MSKKASTVKMTFDMFLNHGNRTSKLRASAGNLAEALKFAK